MCGCKMAVAAGFNGPGLSELLYSLQVDGSDISTPKDLYAFGSGVSDPLVEVPTYLNTCHGFSGGGATIKASFYAMGCYLEDLIAGAVTIFIVVG